MSVHAIKVLLVEDSSVLAEHLAETISGFPEIDLIKSVDSEASALAEIRKRRIDVLVLDLQLKQGRDREHDSVHGARSCSVSDSREYDLPRMRFDERNGAGVDQAGYFKGTVDRRAGSFAHDESGRRSC